LRWPEAKEGVLGRWFDALVVDGTVLVVSVVLVTAVPKVDESTLKRWWKARMR
jgi:hypothetical protein